MGILGKLFGSAPAHPDLDPESEAGRIVEEVMPMLGELAGDLGDSMEVVPAEGTTYVFCGHPPSAFGLVWIRDGKIINLRDVVQSQKMTPQQASALIERLAQAYTGNKDAERYSAKVGRNTVTVTPSEALHADVHKIIQQLSVLTSQ